MPKLANAKKALRKARKNYILNKVVRDRIKRWRKRTTEVVSSGEIIKAHKFNSMYVKVLDKAAKKGVIHKNKANRLKSKMQRKLNEVQGKE